MTITIERLEPSRGLASRPLWVGGKLYAIAPTASAVHPSNELNIAYLRDEVGRIFILTECGELEAPPNVALKISREFFPDAPAG